MYYGTDCCSNVNCRYCYMEMGTCLDCKSGYKGDMCELGNHRLVCLLYISMLTWGNHFLLFFFPNIPKVNFVTWTIFQTHTKNPISKRTIYSIWSTIYMDKKSFKKWKMTRFPIKIYFELCFRVFWRVAD